jgi:hypothetical protein
VIDTLFIIAGTVRQPESNSRHRWEHKREQPSVPVFRAIDLDLRGFEPLTSTVRL